MVFPSNPSVEADLLVLVVLSCSDHATLTQRCDHWRLDELDETIQETLVTLRVLKCFSPETLNIHSNCAETTSSGIVMLPTGMGLR